MVSSSLEAGAVGVLAVHADAHLEHGPQSPCPDGAHTGSVGRRRRNRRGAHGTQIQMVAAVVGASQIFLSNVMLFSLLLLLAAHAAGIAESLIANALLVDEVLVRRSPWPA